MEKIVIKSKKIKHNSGCVIKLTKEAAEALAEVVNESGQSVKSVASQIILQAVQQNLIEYDRS